MADEHAPMWLAVELNGQRHEIELSGPGGNIRFGLGSADGPQSGVWRLWANKNKSDVYLAARSIAGYQKYSFHESGDWRHQWTTGEKATEYGCAHGRILDQWPRGQEIAAGLTPALTIWIPTWELVQPSTVTGAPKETLWVSASESEVAVGFRIGIWEPDRGVLDVSGRPPIAGFALANGTAAFIFLTQEELTPEKRGELDEARKRALREAKLDRSLISLAGNLRLSTHGWDDKGNRHIWDLAVRESDLLNACLESPERPCSIAQ